MTGILRFIGLLNAAAWLGAAVFFTFGASPAIRSSQVETLLGTRHFPYFSVALDQIVARRYAWWLVGFAVVAGLHALAEKLYLGRGPRRGWLGLLLGLVLAAVGMVCFQVPMGDLHRMRHGVNAQPAQKAAAQKAYQRWEAAAGTVNFVMILGLGVYLWRIAYPPDPARFVPTGKFRY